MNCCDKTIIRMIIIYLNYWQKDAGNNIPFKTEHKSTAIWLQMDLMFSNTKHTPFHDGFFLESSLLF